MFRVSKKKNSLLRDKSGASAVEFAIIAPVFLATMFSTFEVGWFYFVNSVVDGATIGISREIRTGQITGGQNFDPDEFFANDVCPTLEFLEDCDTRVTAEVRVFPNFAALAADTSPVVCRDDDPSLVNNIQVDPGNENEIIRVRICLIYDTLNPAIGVNLAKSDDGSRRITSTYVFRNEPYEEL